MQWANSTARYGAIPQTIHWLTAIFIIVGWFLGQFGDIFPRGAVRDASLVVHMTLGECVIVLLLLRLVWRWFNPPPPAEKTPFGRMLELVAKASHYLLYAFLVAVPFFGILVQLKRGNSLPIFAVWHVASPWPSDRAVARTILGIHQLLAYALLALAFVHASAALVHHWVWRDRTLARMLPGKAQAARL
jgi:cytochrome b561